MLIAVGGHSRNIGKTSVMAECIAALREYDWTAMKITQHGHGICSANGAACDCATDYDHPYALSEEKNPAFKSDSARFLAAGAKRSLWLRTAMGQLGVAVPEIRAILDRGEPLIVESNSILQFFRPDVYIAVLDFAVEDFKDTALRYLDRADALVVINGEMERPAWSNVSARLWRNQPQFAVRPPPYASGALLEWLRSRIEHHCLGKRDK